MSPIDSQNHINQQMLNLSENKGHFDMAPLHHGLPHSHRDNKRQRCVAEGALNHN